MNRYLNQRLAARARIRQVEISLRADVAAMHADRAVMRVWREFIALFQSASMPYSIAQQAAATFHRLIPTVVNTVAGSLAAIARYGHRETSKAMRRTLPISYLRAAATRKLFGRPQRIREDLAGSRKPGVIELALRALGLEAVDLADLLREPDRAEIPDDEQAKIFSDLLFPAPSEDKVFRIVTAPVHGVSWINRLEGATRAQNFTPARMAEIVSREFSQGKTPREIAQALLPTVDGIRSTARRLARTESMRIAHEVQHEVFDGLGDLCIGYQLHATMDQHTRSWHAMRDGQIYFKEPKTGQKGLNEMPHPPLEADGSIAWNCRCHTSPVLRPAEWIVNDPDAIAVFQAGAEADKRYAPDPEIYSEWFDSVDDKRRGLAVGVRRLATVEKLVGSKPDWAHFLDPATGDLMGLDALKAETPIQRQARLDQVRAGMRDRSALLAQVRTFGFLTT